MRHAEFVECGPRVRGAGPGHLRADCSGGTSGHSGRLLVLEQPVSGEVVLNWLDCSVGTPSCLPIQWYIV